MRRFRNLWFVPLALVCLCMPTPAQAQVPFRTFGGFGNWGGFGVGNFGGWGGWRGWGFPWGYGWGSGFASPFGWGPRFAYYPGWMGTPYVPYAYERAETIVMPGWSASVPPRARAALYPAIPEPSREVIQAALEEGSKDRALINLRVPAASAQVYLDGVLTKQTGLVRTFVTPRLNPGGLYSFVVEVVWQDANGHNQRVRRQLDVRAGKTSVLDVRDAN